MLRHNPVMIVPLFVIIIVSIGFIYAFMNRQRFLNESMAHLKPIEEISPSPSPLLFASSSPSSSSSSVNIKIDSSVTDEELNANLKPTTLLNFKYPGATTRSESETNLDLVTSINPDPVTDWYKDQIQSLGYNTKSFVVTKTNNNVDNKLITTNGKNTVTIEIKKTPTDKSTTIKVRLDK